jgi:hypothetical protein
VKPTLQPVTHLGRFERLQLVEDLWDEFAAETGMENRPDVLDPLGGDFLCMLAAVVDQLTRNPRAFPSTRSRFRRIMLRRSNSGSMLQGVLRCH